MPVSREAPAPKSAAELRLAFKTMTAHRLPRAVALEKFDALWDEVNGAAASMSAAVSFPDYVGLLKEMQVWYSDELKGPV